MAVLELKYVIMKYKNETLVPECSMKSKSCCSSHFIYKETEAQIDAEICWDTQLRGTPAWLFSSTATLTPVIGREGGRRGAGAVQGAGRQAHHRPPTY